MKKIDLILGGILVVVGLALIVCAQALWREFEDAPLLFTGFLGCACLCFGCGVVVHEKK